MIKRETIGVAAAIVLMTLVYTALAAGQPEHVNLTIKFELADARGRPFIGLKGRQPAVIMTFKNETLQKDCTSCSLNIKSIELINGTAEFKFNLSVRWLGKLVHFSSKTLPVDSSLNNTLIDLGIIKVQASNLEVYGTNDEGERLSGCSFNVEGLGIQVDCGQNLTLPFGVYSLSNARCEIVRGKLVKVPLLTTSLQISNTTSIVEVMLGVASSYLIDVRRADGSPLSGAEVEVVYIDGSNITFYRGVTQGEPIRLRNLPYGSYLVSVTWKTQLLLQKHFQIDRTNRNITLITRLMPAAVLSVLDADNQPITGFALRIMGPAYDAQALTDSLGRVTIQNAVEGLYTLRFTWMNLTFTRQVYLSTGEATVTLPLRRLTLRLTPSSSCIDRCSLPAGLSARVLYGNTLLMNANLTHPMKSVELPLSRHAPTNIPLKLEVYWNSTLLLSESFTPSEKIAGFELPFFDLMIRVNDAKGKPLPQALVTVYDSLGRREFVSDLYGLVDAKYLYGYSAAVEVAWGGTAVAKYLADAALGQVVVSAFVYPVTVEVTGVLGPVTGAQVTIIVFGLDSRFNTSAITGSDGRVELKIPFPPGSNCTLLVTKGRITFEKVLSSRELYGEDEVKVKLDLLLDLELIQLRMGEAAAIVIVVTLSLATTFVLFRYISARRAFERVFSIYGSEPEEEEEEQEGEGLLDRIRSIFGAEGEEEEEGEEEDGLFYEEEL